MRAGAAVAMLILGALVAAGGALADVRPVEAVGVAPVRAERTGAGAPRDAAVDEAVAKAVTRTARALLPPDFVPPAPDATSPPPGFENWLQTILGDDPYDYATRFQILEDRGVRPSLFSDAAQEYVVRVRVHVDAGRILERLQSAGALTTPSGGQGGVEVRIIADGVSSYGAYRALLQTLRASEVVRGARPVSFERGRVVIAVDADRQGPELLAALAAASPPGLRLIPLESTEDGGINVVVDWEAPPPAAAPGD